MKKLFLLVACLLLIFTWSACNKERAPEATDVPVTDKPAVIVKTDAPKETEIVSVTEESVSDMVTTSSPDQLETTEIPVEFRKEGWISSDEAVTLLKMFLGSYSDEGYPYNFIHENTIEKEGKYYYNFRISALITDENGEGAHYSYLTNYLVTTDGIDIIEYVPD